MSQEVADWSLKRVVESILFASQRPVSTKDLHGIFKSAAEMEKADPHAASFSAIKESALRAAIDDWRRNQLDIPTRSEAIRRLVMQALGKHPLSSTKDHVKKRPCDGDSRDHRLQTADHTR